MNKIEIDEFTKIRIQAIIDDGIIQLYKELENIAYHEMNLDMGTRCLITSIITLLVSLLSLAVLNIILIKH